MAADLKLTAHAVRQRLDAMPRKERERRMAAHTITGPDGKATVRYLMPHIAPEMRHRVAMSSGRRARVRKGA
jgi:hypothetical protein